MVNLLSTKDYLFYQIGVTHVDPATSLFEAGPVHADNYIGLKQFRIYSFFLKVNYPPNLAELHLDREKRRSNAVEDSIDSLQMVSLRTGSLELLFLYLFLP